MLVEHLPFIDVFVFSLFILWKFLIATFFLEGNEPNIWPPLQPGDTWLRAWRSAWRWVWASVSHVWQANFFDLFVALPERTKKKGSEHDKYGKSNYSRNYTKSDDDWPF